MIRGVHGHFSQVIQCSVSFEDSYHGDCQLHWSRSRINHHPDTSQINRNGSNPDFPDHGFPQLQIISLCLWAEKLHQWTYLDKGFDKFRFLLISTWIHSQRITDDSRGEVLWWSAVLTWQKKPKIMWFLRKQCFCELPLGTCTKRSCRFGSRNVYPKCSLPFHCRF